MNKIKISVLGLIGIMMIIVLSGSARATEEGNATIEEVRFVYHDHGRRDPLWPLVSSDGVIHNYETEFMASDLALEGVFYSNPGTSAAIINGSVVREGDRIGQYLVQEIGSAKVVLSQGNERIELRLQKGDE
jgi:hypothetical protein